MPTISARLSTILKFNLLMVMDSTMATNESLLKKLKRLYTQLFNISLYNRTVHYHSDTDSEHHEFGETLHDFIDEIIIDISKTDSTITQVQLISTQTELNTDLSAPTITEIDPNKETPAADGLSLYFKNNKALESDPPMAARLRRRIWEHVHSAHRLARSGDGHTAKIHADISIEAMKTLSHYVSASEFNTFAIMMNQQMHNQFNTVININKTNP